MFFNKIKYRLVDLDLNVICYFKTNETKQIEELIIYENNIYKIRQIISEIGGITNLIVSFEKKMIDE